MKQKILERLGYSNRIERMFGRGMMIALTGQRRVGKSCVMRRIYNHIAENEENHVIYIDNVIFFILSDVIINSPHHTTLADTPLARQCNHHSTSKHTFDTIGIP